MTTEAGRTTPSRRPERVRATVLGRLGNGMFRLQTADGREVVAHAALDLRKALTRLLPGDPVLIEISLFDPNKARICVSPTTPDKPSSWAACPCHTPGGAPGTLEDTVSSPPRAPSARAMLRR